MPHNTALRLVTVALLGVASCAQVQVEADADSSAPTAEASVISETTAAPTTASTASPTTVSTTTPTTAPPTTAAHQAPFPENALDLAADLTVTERKVRDSEISDTDARLWGARLQRLYRILSANRDWAPEAVGAVEDDVRPDVELNWQARQDLSALVNSTTLATSLPAWRIREPLPVPELIGYYKEAEEITGVPWEILAAIHLIETRMGRIEGLSTAGAIGPMQFLPATWAECCQGDPANDRDAIVGAGTYLVQRGADTDLDRAIWGYNNSDRYVRAVRAYASVIERNELAYRGFHAFEVYFLSASGLILMPIGYEEPEPIAVDTWLADNPDALVD